jgi:hypothetical protein
MPTARTRAPLVALGIFALLAAMWGGLLRLGWNFPPLDPSLAGVHGPLMVSGFLGTLISMERAVALRARWPFAAPVLTALGGLVLITGISVAGGALLITLGSLGLVVIFAVIVRRQPALFTVTMALGAILWLIGNVVWLVGLPIFRVVLWWAGFLILTIVGERLELSRLLRLSRTSERLFFLAVAVLVIGMGIDAYEGIVLPAAGTAFGIRIAGIGMIALAGWLLRYDIARRTVRQQGLTRFIALCLLSGYLWLGLGGLLRLAAPGAVVSGPYYDAMLHTVFLGFVMSMIFGHAPIILPAVLGRAMSFQPTFYLHLVLLHLSLALRIVGDLGAGLTVRQWGGMLNVIAILAFLFATARALSAKTEQPVVQARQADGV